MARKPSVTHPRKKQAKAAASKIRVSRVIPRNESRSDYLPDKLEMLPGTGITILWREYFRPTRRGHGVVIFHRGVPDRWVAFMGPEFAALRRPNHNVSRIVVDLFGPQPDIPFMMLPRKYWRGGDPSGDSGESARKVRELAGLLEGHVNIDEEDAAFDAHENIEEWEAALSMVKEVVRGLIRGDDDAWRILQKGTKGAVWIQAHC